MATAAERAQACPLVYVEQHPLGQERRRADPLEALQFAAQPPRAAASAGKEGVADRTGSGAAAANRVIHGMFYWQDRWTGLFSCGLTTSGSPFSTCPQEKDIVRLKREARSKGGFYVPPEAKVIFVVRIRGLNKIAPKVRDSGTSKRAEHSGS